MLSSQVLLACQRKIQNIRHPGRFKDSSDNSYSVQTGNVGAMARLDGILEKKKNDCQNALIEDRYSPIDRR